MGRSLRTAPPGLCLHPLECLEAAFSEVRTTGKAGGGGGGGGVANQGGDLTLDRVAVTGNTADLSGFGGGIYSTKGTLNLTESTLSYKIRQPTKQALSS